MNVQWIERVNAMVEPSKWFSGTAGFGYGDDDDATPLDMAKKHQVLYIRKEFHLKDLPTERPMSIFGRWEATATRSDNRGDISHKFSIGYDFRARKVTGEFRQGEQESAFSELQIEGKSVEFEFEMEVDGKKRRTRVTAESVDDENDNLSGKWESFDDQGTTVAIGEWKSKRTERPRFGDGRRGGRRRGEDRQPNTKLILRIRYDDGFICYLNGQEIVRANVEAGSGKKARGIKGHDADREEEFVIEDKSLINLLRKGRNVLSIEGHNNSLDSSDFTLDPRFGYEAYGRYQNVVDKRKEWQYLLGQPQEDWTTAKIEASRPNEIPTNTSKFVVRYGVRGESLNNAMSATRRLFADTGNVIHQALLTGLQPDTSYAFEIQDATYPMRNPRRYFFRTAPALATRPLRFVTGGDMYGSRSKLDAMNSEAGRHSPVFALLGGDLAYANGADANRWYDWVDSWARFAITPDDYCVPMIAVIGNHECSKNLNDIPRRERGDFEPKKRAKFYFSLFPLPQDKTNFVMDFGEYMSLICLDSYHTQTPESQLDWLEKSLAERAACHNLFVCYHRPGFGTLVKDDIEDIRKLWSPLFEKHGVDAVFENDHHVYKRTLPLLAGKMHPDGVTYLGDGAWGVDVRDIPWERASRLGYIARGASENHLIRVTIDDGYQIFDAFSAKSIPIDNYIRVYDRQSHLHTAPKAAVN